MFRTRVKAFSIFMGSLVAVATLCQAEVNPEYIILKDEAKFAKVGSEVAIFGYPLMLMDIKKQYDTYTITSESFRAPINFFANERTQGTPQDGQSFVNIDALRSSAWLDLSNGPIIFQIPEIYKRFFLFELYDAWTNVLATIDQKDTNGKAKEYLLCGPGYKGQGSPGTTLIRSGTNLVYISGLTQCYGPGDYKTLHAIQEGYNLKPMTGNFPASSLSSLIASKEPPQSQLADMEYTDFWGRLNALLGPNPPSAQDVAMQKVIHSLGMDPEKMFNPENSKDTEELGLEKALKLAHVTIDDMAHSIISSSNGWKTILRKESDLGTDYLRRALLAKAKTPLYLSQNLLTLHSDRDNRGI